MGNFGIISPRLWHYKMFRYIPNISFTADDEHFAVHMIGAGVSIIPSRLGGIILTDGLEGLDSSSSFLMPETF